MARFLLLSAVTFLTPFLAYAGWLAAFGDGVGRKAWPLRTVFALSGVGFVLTAGTIVALTSFEIHPPNEGDYVPPSIRDGRIVPGHFR